MKNIIDYIKKINKSLVENIDEDQSYEISELHMHKILYFLYGIFYWNFDKELFNPNFQAWKFGPVEINYRTHKNNLENNMSLFYDEEKLNTEEKIFLEKLTINLLKNSPWYLVEISHKTDPWKNNYNENEKFKKIENYEIKKYFNDEWNSIGDFNTNVLNYDVFLNNGAKWEKEKERFGIFWKGKNEAKFISNTQSIKTLKPNYEKSVNFDYSDNIVIEGDNLEVLKIIQNSYQKSIDIIYIDPPYNTGNDFIYNDNFYEIKNEYLKSTDQIDDKGNRLSTNTRTNGRFHSKWLSMIYSRLLVARTLLNDSGIIFISIDDNEQSRLKLMCDEIFGESNFIGNFFWQSNNSVMKNVKFFRNDFEYIICYSKNKNFLNDFLKKENKKIEFSNPDNDINGEWFSSNATLQYNEKSKNTFEITLPNGDKVIRTWKFSKEDLLNNKVNLYYKNSNVPRLKIYKKDYDIKKPFSNILLSNKKLIDDDYFNYSSSFTISKNEVSNLLSLESNIMNSFTPKPIDLIMFLLRIYNNKNALVLDFFAGSGSTGHAVMELNKEDGGNRKYILIQIGEKINDNVYTSLTDILRDRLKNSINKYGYKEKGFKFFELANPHRNFNDITLDKNNISQLSFNDIQNILCIENGNSIDFLYEIILRDGLRLDHKFEKIKINNDVLYFDESKTNVFILNECSLEFIEDFINEIWNEKNHNGKLRVFINDDSLTDNLKTNLIHFISQLKNSKNGIVILTI